MAKIGKFETRPVVQATVKLMKAGDGLSNALKLDPIALPIGAEVHLVLRGTVRRVTFDPTKDDPDELARVHVVWTEEVALVDGSAVSDMLGAERDRLRVMREELDGVSHLNFDPDLLDQEDSPSEALIRENLGAP